MAALDFPTATAAGQTFEADTGVIYVYVGTPPNGFWSANATVSGQAALDARYVQVAGDSMTGALNIAGNVGIGTTSPTTKVEVVDTLQATANNDYTLAIRGDDSGTDGESAQIFLGAINATTRGTVIAAERQSTSNNHDLIFKTSAASAAPTERLRIDSSGNVGIGTASPSYQLDVQAAGNSRIQVKNSSVTGESQFHHDGNGDLYIKNTVSGRNIAFSNAGSERMRIDSSGNVGIGTNSPGVLLDAAGSNPTLRVKATTANTEVSTIRITEDNNYVGAYFKYDGSTNLTHIGTHSAADSSTANDNHAITIVRDTRNVGIGDSNPSFKLDVNGDIGIREDNNLTFHDGTGTAAFRIRGDSANKLHFERASNNSAQMIIDNGKVGIGTTSPISELHVENSSGNCGARVISGTSGVSYLNLGDTADNNIGSIEYDNAVNALKIITNNNERMRIDSSGRLLVGTSSASGSYLVQSFGNSGSSTGSGGIIVGRATSSVGSASTVGSVYFNNTNSDTLSAITCFSDGTQATNSSTPGAITLSTTASGASSSTERMRIDSSGNVGIGTTSPGSILDVRETSTGGSTEIRLFNTDQTNTTTQTASIAISPDSRASGARVVAIKENADFSTSAARDISLSFESVLNGTQTERMRIDSSGRLLVGTSSTSESARAILQGNSFSSTGGCILKLSRGNSTPNDGGDLGNIQFTDSGHVFAANISAKRDGGTWTSGSSQPTRLEFSTTANSASSPTERMRIDSSGNVLIGTTYTNLYQKNSSNDEGASVVSNELGVANWQGTVAYFNRMGNDGTIINFFGQGVSEGSISLSGNTISYNGAHLSRWSQLPGNAIRFNILRGTVLSNIDEMCEWGDENNEQLNRMKISDVEGDRNVSGVFQGWDEDDEEYTDDFYCAMTGDFIIRIGKDVTVELGDLLMSAGDGTAKPQEDDIIRSKTIAKVTSTHVSETYADGSYCVPCVLMAC